METALTFAPRPDQIDAYGDGAQLYVDASARVLHDAGMLPVGVHPAEVLDKMAAGDDAGRRLVGTHIARTIHAMQAETGGAQ